MLVLSVGNMCMKSWICAMMNCLVAFLFSNLYISYQVALSFYSSFVDTRLESQAVQHAGSDS
jgi:hypothetical protein